MFTYFFTIIYLLREEKVSKKPNSTFYWIRFIFSIQKKIYILFYCYILRQELFFENHIHTRISKYANYGPLDKNCYVILVIFPEHDFLFESSSTYCGGAVCSSWRKAKSNDGYKQDVALITSQVKRTQQDNSSCHGAVACLSCLS